MESKSRVLTHMKTCVEHYLFQFITVETPRAPVGLKLNFASNYVTSTA